EDEHLGAGLATRDEVGDARELLGPPDDIRQLAVPGGLVGSSGGCGHVPLELGRSADVARAGRWPSARRAPAPAPPAAACRAPREPRAAAAGRPACRGGRA